MNKEITDNLTGHFIREFGYSPVFAARAPGRVNLIGEHTDYNGCPVLPMALERCFTAVFSPSPSGRNGEARSGGKVPEARIVNADSRFPKLRFAVEKRLPPGPTGDWGNYVRAGFQTILDYAEERGPNGLSSLRGIDVVLSSDIPAAAGLSSSSALVVISALMLLTVLKIDIPKHTLADICAKGERYVGTQGGGMDQAACLLSEQGKALKIDFNPLRAAPADMPPGYTVVVMDSTVKAEKTKSAMDRYNLRVVECRLGAAVLKDAYNRRYGIDVKLELLGDMTPVNLDLREDEIIPFAVEALPRQSYGLEDITEILGTSSDVLAAEYCRRRDGSIMPAPPGGFKLLQRVLHILTEWKRVEDSADRLIEGDAPGFGILMNGSHESCRTLYEISCPELDALTDIARIEGALGARLTGAGFGGCAVALVKDDDLQRFMDAIVRRYYKDYLKLGDTDFSGRIFVCRPVGGAAVEKL